MRKFYKILADIILWALLIWGVWALFSCNRKPRFEQLEEVPNLPPDTVYVASKTIGRSNYFYLNANPKIAGARMDIAVKALDSVVSVYHEDLESRKSEANHLYRQIMYYNRQIVLLKSSLAEKKIIYKDFKKRYEAQNKN